MERLGRGQPGRVLASRESGTCPSRPAVRAVGPVGGPVGRCVGPSVGARPRSPRLRLEAPGETKGLVGWVCGAGGSRRTS